MTAAGIITSIIMWLVFGFVVGFIVHLLDRSEFAGGFWGTVLTGVIGALVGGFLSSIIFGVGVTGFNIQSIVISVAGALIFASIERYLARNRNMVGFKGGRSRKNL